MIFSPPCRVEVTIRYLSRKLTPCARVEVQMTNLAKSSLHRMLNREPETSWRIAVVRKYSERRSLGCAGVSAKMSSERCRIFSTSPASETSSGRA